MGDTMDLVRFNADDAIEVAELTRQRILCGWGVEHMDTWCAQSRVDDKNLYWLMPTSPSVFTFPEVEMLSLEGKPGPPPASPSFRPLGHVSLDWVDYSGDDSLTSREGGLVTIATFFILQSQQNKGLGRLTMDKLEALAAGPGYNAVAITLNTMPQENQSSPEFWASLGLIYDTTARINQHWYARRGYTVYKHAPRYQQADKDGKIITLTAVFMRKELNAAVKV